MSDATVPQELLDFIKSLASESRIKIVLLFFDGQERTVNQIADAVGLGQPTTSEHLAILRRAGVLRSIKHGKEVYYGPDRSQIIQSMDALSQMLRQCCQE
jgi:DNA-binding transcriptional ArsR family regulator